MRSNYKRLGDFIELVDIRNNELSITTLLGLSISKQFIPSVANTVGTNMKNYKIIKRNQFACSIMQVRRDKKMPVALLKEVDEAIISQAYPVFQVINENILSPDYLMMWFSREEFDRQATFWAVGGVRGSLEWDDFLDFELPIPSIEEQRAIVAEYKTVTDRIQLNEQINTKLEETAQALYGHWFVDFEFPDENGNPYKSSGGKMVHNKEMEKEVPVGWEAGSFLSISNIIMGQSPSGDSYNTECVGTVLINGPVEFGEYFTARKKWTTEPTRISEVSDLIVCVRGSTVGRFVKCDGVYCLGRGVCAFRGKHSQSFVDETYKYHLKNMVHFSIGSTFPSWDKDFLHSYQILVPSTSVQKEFSNVEKPIRSEIESNAIYNQSLKKFQSLLLSRMAGSKLTEKASAV